MLWRSELRNTLVKCSSAEPDRYGRSLPHHDGGGIDDGRSEFDVVSGDVLSLASTSGCSAYDAEFVVLARDLRVPLVTTDKELLEKFPETAVSPEGFLARR